MESRFMMQRMAIALAATSIAAAALALTGAPGAAALESTTWDEVAVVELARPAGDLGPLSAAIRDAGGTLLLASEDWAWVDLPREAEPVLAGRPGLVVRIERAPWPGPYASPIEASAAQLLGEIQRNLETDGQPFLPGPPVAFPHPDAIAEEGGERLACDSNPSGDWPPVDERYLGRTHVMQGTVTANFFLVESDANGPENLYSWDSGTVTTVLAKIQAALLWWQNEAAARGRQVTFGLVSRLPSAPECQVPVEPVNHSVDIVNSTVVPHIMSGLGFSGSGRCATGRFNDSQRGSNDRAFSAFLFTGATAFTDGGTSWAWKNGSYLASVANPAGYGIGLLDRVLAHETGHIFRACDEYAGQPNCTSCCTSCVPCITGAEPNGNCEAGGAGCGVLATCVMRHGETAVCSFTADQIGWDEYRAPALLYPAAGQTVLTGQVPLRLRAFGATRYHVQVDDWSGFACPEFDGVVADSVVLTSMLPEGAYYWRARAGDALNAFGPWSATGTFTVDYPASPPAGIHAILTGPGPAACVSPTWVRAFDSSTVPLRTSFLTQPGASYGVHVAAGDLDDDGIDEIITGLGTQDNYNTDEVRVFAADGTPGVRFVAYGNPDYRGGLNVAAGDVDGQGGDEIITGPGWFLGNTPSVRLWRADGTLLGGFEAYPGANHGVNVAAGDIDGDGRDEIITGPGPNGSFVANVAVWRREAGGAITQVSSFIAFPDFDLRYGAIVAAGDIDGDGRDEIIVGPGPSPDYGPSVEMWRVSNNGTATWLGRFDAYPSFVTYGVNVGAGDVDGDGRDEIVTGPGPNPGNFPLVRMFRIGPDYSSTLLASFYAYSQTGTAGAYVAVADFRPAAASAWSDAAGGALGDYRQGQGVAWGDYDRDGDLDLYLSNIGANKLFRNDGGAFADATPALLADAGRGSGIAWGDYDDDGDLDLYLANANTGDSNTDRPARLFRNVGGGAFADATSNPLGYVAQGRSVAWADYDRDGDLDLFLASTNGYNQLYRNDTGGAFADATPALLRTAGPAKGAAWSDHDADGDLDLYLSMESGGTNRLFRNDGGGAFADATSGPLAQPGQGGGPAWGDYDNDGDLDLYLSRTGANKLLRNDGGGVFTDATSGPLGDTGAGKGAAWGDFDLDGDLDLYLANADGPNRLLRNDGGGAFADATPALLADGDGDGEGVAWADYDGDGDLDLYLTNDQGPGRLFRNLLPPGNHWLEVDLVGLMTNAAAIGARVRVVAGGVAQIREIEGGSGYLSQNSLTAEFGLGAATAADTLEVRWTTGRTDVWRNVAADQQLVIHEVLAAAVEAGPAPAPTAYRVYDNVPNPFNPATTIGYDLPEAAPVSLRVYDIGGRLVRVLERGERREAGHHQVVWDGRDDAGRPAASGVYFYRHEAGAASQVRRMVLLK